ncbi:hypothetical protein TOPH_03782 [Tolypocladium ophioglossoides CBS 100239]|uniref:Uncharacterized protein n=1 Tax=Tolypocladium ophioglossoides (strain CBS 100239) TaxID=1163406 RepID=A0A0L0NC03_TOLOC|nr:hypothetical protein TOPH_03782 [Tolypocladium ophioglossoides CBS 100239]
MYGFASGGERAVRAHDDCRRTFFSYSVAPTRRRLNVLTADRTPTSGQSGATGCTATAQAAHGGEYGARRGQFPAAAHEGPVTGPTAAPPSPGHEREAPGTGTGRPGHERGQDRPSAHWTRDAGVLVWVAGERRTTRMDLTSGRSLPAEAKTGQEYESGPQDVVIGRAAGQAAGLHGCMGRDGYRCLHVMAPERYKYEPTDDGNGCRAAQTHQVTDQQPQASSPPLPLPLPLSNSPGCELAVKKHSPSRKATLAKMQFSLAAAAGLLAVAQARITGIAVPETIRPGDSFNATIHSSNYIQSVFDVAITFGYAAGDGYPDSLGLVAASICLGKDQSNQMNDFKKWITIPASVPKGRGIVTASLTSLYGAVAMPVLSNYNVTITFGDVTSSNYVSSP